MMTHFLGGELSLEEHCIAAPVLYSLAAQMNVFCSLHNESW